MFTDLPEIAKMNQESRPVLETPSQLVSGLTQTCNVSCSSANTGSTSSSVFASLFASSKASKSFQVQPQSQSQSQTTGFKDFIQTMTQPTPTPTPDLSLPSPVQEPVSLCLSTSQGPSIFRQYAPPPQPAMSATALLQKAAQMGASASGASLLRGYGIERDDTDGGASIGLGLGVGYDGRAGLQELMMGPKLATLDFLGLGMAVGGGTTNGLSALMTSIGGGLGGTTTVSSFVRGGSGEFTGKDVGPQ